MNILRTFSCNIWPQAKGQFSAVQFSPLTSWVIPQKKTGREPPLNRLSRDWTELNSYLVLKQTHQAETSTAAPGLAHNDNSTHAISARLRNSLMSFSWDCTLTSTMAFSCCRRSIWVLLLCRSVATTSSCCVRSCSDVFKRSSKSSICRSYAADNSCS